MNRIQTKILTLTTIVLVIMSVIWGMLTYYNHKTQSQYNDILQRYLNMNEVTSSGQQLITDMNNYMLNPTNESLSQLERSIKDIQNAKYKIYHLRNTENDLTLSNYIHLTDTLIQTTERTVMFFKEKDSESAAREFSEATSITNYISEMTLTLMDTELKTYDSFYRGIIKQSNELTQLGIWVLLLITFILLLATYWFSLGITKPIDQLTKAANELSKGKFDQQIKIDTKDEIAFLAKTFDRMRININNLILEIKKKAQLEKELQQSKILLQESQFRSLQSQINPHFLFNTLNTISKKAYLEGSEETSDMLAKVASLLRYNLKRIDRSVTIGEEAEVLKQYMDIQKARFTDRLHFITEIDTNCLVVKIPALTLQPIIENAVIHAVEPKEEGGVINFRVIDMDNRVLVEIEDDGFGMSEEVKKRILSGESVPTSGHSTGIGLSNVVKRLRLFYGYEDVMQIESNNGQGTKVSLILKK